MNNLEKLQKQAEILSEMTVILKKQAEIMLEGAIKIEKNSIDAYNEISKILGNEKR